MIAFRISSFMGHLYGKLIDGILRMHQNLTFFSSSVLELSFYLHFQYFPLKHYFTEVIFSFVVTVSTKPVPGAGM